jgi:hypothetical protein
MLWAPRLQTATDSNWWCFPTPRSSDHGDHAPALHIVAAELELHSCGAKIGGHAPERITQAVGRLGPAHRTAHGIADHRFKPGMKFCDGSGEALPGQLGQRHVERGASSARSRASALLIWQAAIASPSCIPKACLHALTHSAKSARRGGRSSFTCGRFRSPATVASSKAPRIRGCRSENSRQNCASSLRISNFILRNSTISARSRKSHFADDPGRTFPLGRRCWPADLHGSDNQALGESLF